jgi:hypothetical protein
VSHRYHGQLVSGKFIRGALTKGENHPLKMQITKHLANQPLLKHVQSPQLTTTQRSSRPIQQGHHPPSSQPPPCSRVRHPVGESLPCSRARRPSKQISASLEGPAPLEQISASLEAYPRLRASLLLSQQEH